jgi:predicted nucleic acid-binding protein
MKDKIIVLDASVAIKMLHEEQDSELAQAFLEKCVASNTRVFVPEHFFYELANVCQKLDIELVNALEFFDAMKGGVLTVITPNKSIWLLAEKISREGHIKSGFPSMYDSIYHAIAIESKGVFVTADRRHFAKTEKFSHICLLNNWENGINFK